MFVIGVRLLIRYLTHTHTQQQFSEGGAEGPKEEGIRGHEGTGGHGPESGEQPCCHDSELVTLSQYYTSYCGEARSSVFQHYYPPQKRAVSAEATIVKLTQEIQSLQVLS